LNDQKTQNASKVVANITNKPLAIRLVYIYISKIYT